MPSKNRRAAPGKPRLHPIVLPAAAVGLTFLIRLWFILEMQGHPFSVISPQVVDSYYYHQWALDILHESFWGSDVFFLRPLYPYLLALVYAVFGQKVVVVQLIQALMGAGSCFLLYDSTRRIFDRASGIIAAFGFALSGILVFYTGTLLYVELTVLLGLLFVWLMLGAGRTWWRWLLAGLSYGLLTICRPELLVLAPFCLLILWRRRDAAGPGQEPRDSSPARGEPDGRPGGRPPSPSPSPWKGEGLKGRGRPARLRDIAVMTAAAVLVIATVPVRNLVVSGEPVLFTAHSGINFYYANNPDADGTWHQTGELERSTGFSHRQLERAARTIDGKELSWSRASGHWLREGLGFIFGNPGRFLALLGRKLLLFIADYEVPNNYYPETARAASNALKLAFLPFGLLLALGTAGMLRAWKERRRAWPAYLLTAGFLFSSLVFYVLSRLRAPVIPFLLMFAGFGLTALVRALRQRRWTGAGIDIAVIAAVFIASLAVPIDRAVYSSQAWTQLGNVWLEQKQAGPAIEALRRALERNPANPSTRYSLVIAWAGMGRVAEAESELERLVAATAGSPRDRGLVDLARARVAIARRDFPEAVRYYREALAREPDNGEARYLLGLVYVSMDRLELARPELARAVELDPANQDARSALERVDSRLGRRPVP